MKYLSVFAMVFLFCFSAYAKSWTTPQEQGGTDSTAIQAAVDTGLDVYFEGTFSIGATITVTSKNGQTFWGPGTLILQASRPLGTQFFNVDTANNIVFRYLKFDGNKVNQIQPPSDNSWNSGLPRAYFTPIDMAHSSNVKIENCEFYDVATTSINFYDGFNIQIRSNEFHDSYMDAIFTNLEDEVSNISVDVVVERNDIRDLTYRNGQGDVINAYANGMIVDANDLVIRYNTIDTVDRSGMKPSDIPRSNILIEYNTILNCAWAGINPQSGSDITIRYNEITDVGTIGVSISPISQTEVRSNLTIEDNIITRAGFGTAAGAKAGVFATGGTTGGISNVVVQRNIIADCNRFGIYIIDIDGSLVEGNTISDSTIYNLFIDGDLGNYSDTVSFLNNSLTGSTYGVRIEDYAKDLTFGNTDIDQTTVSGYYLNSPDGTTIENSRIENIDANGIVIVSATSTLIDNNEILKVLNSGLLVLGTPDADDITVTNTDFAIIGQYGMNILGNPTNVTLGPGNTFTSIGIDDINWPNEP